MSAPLDSGQHAKMLESCFGAIPLGVRDYARPGSSTRLSVPAASSGARPFGPVRVGARTQEDVIRLIRITQSQGIAVESPGWMLTGSQLVMPRPSAVVIDLRRLDHMCSVANDAATAEAGTVLAQLDRACQRHSRTLGRALRALRTPVGSLAAQIVDFTLQGHSHPQASQLKAVKVVSVCPSPMVEVFSPTQLCDWLLASGHPALLLEVELAVAPIDADASQAPAGRAQSTLA